MVSAEDALQLARVVEGGLGSTALSCTAPRHHIQHTLQAAQAGRQAGRQADVRIVSAVAELKGGTKLLWQHSHLAGCARFTQKILGRMQEALRLKKVLVLH